MIHWRNRFNNGLQIQTRHLSSLERDSTVPSPWRNRLAQDDIHYAVLFPVRQAIGSLTKTPHTQLHNPPPSCGAERSPLVPPSVSQPSPPPPLLRSVTVCLHTQTPLMNFGEINEGFSVKTSRLRDPHRGLLFASMCWLKSRTVERGQHTDRCRTVFGSLGNL